jgi:DNA-directed RNA polymerase subunit RPC12/RpoP
MRIEIHADTENGCPVRSVLKAIYLCPDCGFENELVFLNANNQNFISLEESRVDDIMCHKCGHKNVMTTSVRASDE